MRTLRPALLLALASCALAAQAAPLVSYNVSGSAGAYVLDFSVTNTLGGSNGIYFFGVVPPSFSAAPSGWDVFRNGAPWDNVAFGGSAQVYTSNWFTDPFGGSTIQAGDTLSGFRITTATLPLGGVQWFAYAARGAYWGGDNFNSYSNPGFEGTAFAATSAVPGPMAALPFALMALKRRKRA